mgnify:CR=1 FL=1
MGDSHSNHGSEANDDLWFSHVNVDRYNTLGKRASHTTFQILNELIFSKDNHIYHICSVLLNNTLQDNRESPRKKILKNTECLDIWMLNNIFATFY